MEVVNVKVKHIRPKHHDLREWMQDPNNLYVGRRGIVFIDGVRFPPDNSPYANPFRVTATNSREEATAQFEAYIRARFENEPEFKDQFMEDMANHKVLGCWCYPEQCHGNTLIKLYEEFL